MDETGANGWKLRAIGIVVGAAIAVAGGSYSMLQMDRTPPVPATPGELLAKLASIEAGIVENRHRIEALERPGGTTPMSREARERFESVDRVLADIQRQLALNTTRLDSILADRRGR